MSYFTETESLSLFFNESVKHVFSYPLQHRLPNNANSFDEIVRIWSMACLWRKFDSRNITKINDNFTSTWLVYKLCRVILNPTHNKPHTFSVVGVITIYTSNIRSPIKERQIGNKCCSKWILLDSLISPLAVVTSRNNANIKNTYIIKTRTGTVVARHWNIMYELCNCY